MSHKVVIVGRTNVGKSTLFNRLSTSVKSMIMDYAGVTRDFIADTVSWSNKVFELVDTGGIGLRKTVDAIEQHVESQVRTLIDKAAVVLFVCDGTVGLMPEEQRLARLLHKAGKQVIVVVNKSDVKASAEHMHEFERLGFARIIGISAQHGTGTADVLEEIVRLLPATTPEEPEKPHYRVVLLGKPNVGKSSLMNILVEQERSIVNEVAGTTREPVREDITFYQEHIQLVDTAGLRRKRRVEEGIETLMAKSSLGALRQADIVLLLVDSSQGTIADQELKLAFYALEQGKALIILFNKQDLHTSENQAQLAHSLEAYTYLMNMVESLTISCKTGKNVGRVLPLIKKVWGRYSQEIPSLQLNTLFQGALEHKPLYHKTRLLELYRARQIDTAPMVIQLGVNQPSWFGESQLKFFENILRREVDLKGVPVLFTVKKGK